MVAFPIWFSATRAHVCFGVSHPPIRLAGCLFPTCFSQPNITKQRGTSWFGRASGTKERAQRKHVNVASRHAPSRPISLRDYSATAPAAHIGKKKAVRRSMSLCEENTKYMQRAPTSGTTSGATTPPSRRSTSFLEDSLSAAVATTPPRKPKPGRKLLRKQSTVDEDATPRAVWMSMPPQQTAR